MTPSERKFCSDNVLKTSQLYGNDNVRYTATNKLGKDINVPRKMTPQEIITELRKISTYSTSKKEVCTQAADLIEEFQEEYDIISAANIELHSTWQSQNIEISRLKEELEKMTASRDNWKYETERHQDIAVEALKEKDKLYKLTGYQPTKGISTNPPNRGSSVKSPKKFIKVYAKYKTNPALGVITPSLSPKSK